MKELMKGWVRVSDYDQRPNKSLGGPTGDYARILAALHQEPSPIRAYKDGKFWIAVQSDVDSFLESMDEPEDVVSCTPDFGQKKQEDPAKALHDAMNLMEMRLTLGRIESILERLAVAAESLATQPQTPQQELLHAIGGNGFHS